MSANTLTYLPPDEAAAVRAVPGRIVAAWARHDADAFAAVFTDDASLIMPNDVHFTGRDHIRALMATLFAGSLKGTRVTGVPIGLKPLGPGVVLLLTKGGVLKPGDKKLTAEAAIRASWLLTKRDGEWLITAYQNTPIGTR